MVLKTFKIALRLRDWQLFLWQSLEILTCWYFNFKTNFEKNKILFQKPWVQFFSWKYLDWKRKSAHRKLPCQKPILKQIKWRVQTGSITKKRVLPGTSLFFSKFSFSQSNAHINIFYKRLSLVQGVFSLWVSLI